MVLSGQQQIVSHWAPSPPPPDTHHLWWFESRKTWENYVEFYSDRIKYFILCKRFICRKKYLIKKTNLINFILRNMFFFVYAFGKRKSVSAKFFSIHRSTRLINSVVSYSLCQPPFAVATVFPLRTNPVPFITPTSFISVWFNDGCFRKLSTSRCLTSRSTSSSLTGLFKNLATRPMVARRSCGIFFGQNNITAILLWEK